MNDDPYVDFSYPKTIEMIVRNQLAFKRFLRSWKTFTAICSFQESTSISFHHALVRTVFNVMNFKQGRNRILFKQIHGCMVYTHIWSHKLLLRCEINYENRLICFNIFHYSILTVFVFSIIKIFCQWFIFHLILVIISKLTFHSH